MTTSIAVSAYKAAHLLFDEGFPVDDIRRALDAIPQPAKGYYRVTDVYKWAGENKPTDYSASELMEEIDRSAAP